MVEYKGTRYYGVCEIARILNETPEEYKQFVKKFRDVFRKNDYVTEGWIQNRIYGATYRGNIRYITYHTAGCERKYKGFSIEDITDYINRFELKTKIIEAVDVEVIEVMEE